MGHRGKVLTALSTATHGEDDAHLRVLLLQLDEGAQATLGAINGHLSIGPLIAHLIVHISRRSQTVKPQKPRNKA